MRAQQRKLVAGNDNVPRSAWNPDDTQEPGECEVAALAIWYLQRNSITVAPDGIEVAFGSWSIANAQSFDEGLACGDVSDRTTSTAAFDFAFARTDGAGFGNLLFFRADYLASGERSEIDTAIQSSLTSAMVVSSLGGNINDNSPGTMFYGGPYFSAHVSFASSATNASFSFPLLFHTPSLCHGENVTLDFYGAAASAFADDIGGSIGYFTHVNQTGAPLDLRFVSSAIILDDATFVRYVVNQAVCDVFEAPSYGPAAWAECSTGTQYVNTSVSVGGCEVLVSPARWVLVGNLFNQTGAGFTERYVLWLELLSPLQTEILELSLKAISARQAATNGVTQTTTQVGFELNEANNDTEWILVLIVALEVVFGVVALAVSSLYARWKEQSSQDELSIVEAFGKVASVAVLLSLGLVPLYFARAAESNAAQMAHIDVHTYFSDTSNCFSATWEGGSADELWCITTRVVSQSLLVRAYSKTLLRNYDSLVWAATFVGGVGFVTYAALSISTAAQRSGP